jgi:phenylpyruvate tautomerase PptA (4-oxalocrotonate tautomerase family)
MPVIMIHSLELRDEQKRDIAQKFTQILSESTKVPESAIYIFFGDYPLQSIAAGGMLNSELPDEVLAQFDIKYNEAKEE